MQFMGHIWVHWPTLSAYKILCRTTKTCRYLKLRKGGEAGKELIEEGTYLDSREGRKNLIKLLNGETIAL
jgi:hypothetical protein